MFNWWEMLFSIGIRHFIERNPINAGWTFYFCKVAEISVGLGIPNVFDEGMERHPRVSKPLRNREGSSEMMRAINFRFLRSI